MKKSQAVIGSVFGNWTVIGELPPRVDPTGHTRHRVRARCVCGTEADHDSASLVGKRSKSCRPCAVRSIKPGERFDRLTTIGYIKHVDAKGRVRSMVDCRCDCGNHVQVRVGVLQSNKTNNCGCAPRGAWTGSGDLSTTRFNRYRKGAEARKLEFSVSIDDLWTLFENQKRRCALSGLPIGFSMKSSGRNTASLDRINSDLGYVKGNVQWVHRDVNRMKNDLPQDRFLEMCAAITKYRCR